MATGKERDEAETRVGAARRKLRFAEAELKEALQEATGSSQAGMLGGEEAGQGTTVWPIEPEPNLDWIFSYHPPSFADHPKYTAIRSAARYFAQVILDNAPVCADRSAAIRHVRDAVMTANASIALGGRL